MRRFAVTTIQFLVSSRPHVLTVVVSTINMNPIYIFSGFVFFRPRTPSIFTSKHTIILSFEAATRRITFRGLGLPTLF